MGEGLMVQTVIDVKDQMTLKVLWVIQWSLAPRWGAIQVPRIERRGEKDE
jgi:hypothetical protein